MFKKIPYLDIKRSHKNILKTLHVGLDKTISGGQLVLGKNLETFEKEYSKFSGVKYTAGVANGLDALILSLLALDVGKRDEVIVPSNTYIATLLAISRVGATPVLVEPDISTYNINPLNVEKHITKKTKAIIPVHLYGQVCEMDKILKIANKNKIFIVEDNAQAHGAMFKNASAGSFGEVNATSFYPGKNLGALGDGGAITTDNKKLYEKILILRNYGSENKYVNNLKGYNSRLDELQAAFLLTKLKYLKKNNVKRQDIAKNYLKYLQGVGDIILPVKGANSTHVYHVFAIRTKKRNKLQKYLTDKGIGTLIHYPIPPHLQVAYRELGKKKGDFPLAEEIANTELSLPIYPELTLAEQKYIISSIKNYYAD